MLLDTFLFQRVCTRKKTLDNLAYHTVLRTSTESIPQKYWTAAKEVLKASTSLEKFLQLADGNASLIDLNEPDDALPDASVRRHQEAILHARCSGPEQEVQSSLERLRRTSGRTIAKIGIRNPLPMRE